MTDNGMAYVTTLNWLAKSPAVVDTRPRLRFALDRGVVHVLNFNVRLSDSILLSVCRCPCVRLGLVVTPFLSSFNHLYLLHPAVSFLRSSCQLPRLVPSYATLRLLRSFSCLTRSY
jgi:hypothetical protein